MSSQETNLQQGVVYDIFHWSAVMLGLEAPNEDDEFRRPSYTSFGGYDADTSAGVAVLIPNQWMPSLRPANNPPFYGSFIPLALSAGMNEPASPDPPVTALIPGGSQMIDPLTVTTSNDHEEGNGKTVAATDEFRFESGFRVIDSRTCKTVQYCATPSSSKSKIRKRKGTDPDTDLKCDYPGCTSQRSFKRQYELTRHKEGHSTRPYECPVLGCQRRGELAFGRAEKLRDHLHQGHSTDALFECLLPGCHMKTPSLILFYVHHQRHKVRCLASEVWMRNLPKWGWGCPIVDCNLHSKLCDIERIKNHLIADHGDSERQGARTDLTAYGIDPVSMYRDCCPLCGDEITITRHFKNHHDVIDKAHVEAWDSSLKDLDSRLDFGFHFDSHWDAARYDAEGRLADQSRVCPYCQTRVFRGRKSLAAHERSMFGTSQDTRHHREVLLRLMPGLVFHPVFDDLEAGSEPTDASGTASNSQQPYMATTDMSSSISGVLEPI